jgi:hypothetical protein
VPVPLRASLVLARFPAAIKIAGSSEDGRWGLAAAQ